jgi:hypothetical protein
VAFLWKQLVGRQVFAVSETSRLPVPVYVHSSVHCGQRHGASHTAVLINFHYTQSARIQLSVPAAGAQTNPHGSSRSDHASGNMTAFVLQGPVYSDRIRLNGALLDLHSDGSLPSVKGAPLPAGAALTLPAASIAFLEVTGDKLCV